MTLVGSASMTLEAGVDSFVDPGATAHSTPLSAAVPPASVVATVPAGLLQGPVGKGQFTVSYTATDSQGNVGTATRAVAAVDTLAPEVTLVGAASMEVEVGGTWTDPGASATDVVDGSVSVVTSGAAFSTAMTGTHTVTYTATDASSNSGSANRTVVVVGEWPCDVARCCVVGRVADDGVCVVRAAASTSGGGNTGGNPANNQANAPVATPDEGLDGFLCGVGCFVIVLVVGVVVIGVAAWGIVKLTRHQRSRSSEVVPVRIQSRGSRQAFT